MTELFTTLMAGNIIEAILGAYTGVMGQWFMIIILFLGFTMVYIKTENIGTLGIMGIVILPLIITTIIPDRFTSIILIIMALSIVAILWKGLM